MNTAISRDGTPIAFDRAGAGPALILVDGALCYRESGPNGPLAAILAEHFTVYTYDRRGRGDSGDTAPYAVDREVEDIEALIAEAGGSADLYGISSGAALALEAAHRGLPIGRLAVYETPFIVDHARAPIPEDYVPRLHELIAADQRAEAVTLFMRTGIGLSPLIVTMMRFMPAWSTLKKLAHTLPYDAVIIEAEQKGRPLSPTRWDAITAPTLVIGGGKSPEWMRNGVRALAAVLPNAHRQELPGQTHLVKPKALAPVLLRFFTADHQTRGMTVGELDQKR